MKPLFVRGPLAAVCAVIAFSGCAASQDGQRAWPAPSHASETMTSGVPGLRMATMDMMAMCNMHQKMISARTPEEQTAMMTKRMKNMSPEMQKKHTAMMRLHCE